MSRTYDAETLMRMSRFNESRLLLAGVELDLFTLLAPSPLSVEEVVQKTGTDARGMAILLDALSALEFLKKQDNRYQTSPSVTPFLSGDSPDSILAGLRHAAHLWYTWTQLTEVVATGKQPERPVTSFTQDRVQAFIGAMHAGASRAASRIVEAIQPGEARALIDVGGASGTYTLAFLESCPQMKATLFDLPPVIEMARERIGKADMLERVALVPGDFYQDELPPGHDLALLSAIIHQNNLGQNLDLYQKIYRALESGGRIVIRDHVMSSDRTSPVSGALFAVNMLVNTPGGGTYTFEEIEQGLTEAGFTRVGLIQTEGMFSLVEAFKP
jgi:ubiquinone/menaquinone biosynthesis C-methylase UbiE